MRTMTIRVSETRKPEYSEEYIRYVREKLAEVEAHEDDPNTWVSEEEFLRVLWE
ncbi:hypothetical protein FACS1894217_04430 [Clostridia bacterium]|nr:hypothetical protein FACS1894217_04430 [Clostridia bacterium]